MKERWRLQSFGSNRPKLELNENRISELFADFFMGLPNSDYVLSPEETIAQLDEMIEAFEND